MHLGEGRVIPATHGQDLQEIPLGAPQCTAAEQDFEGDDKPLDEQAGPKTEAQGYLPTRVCNALPLLSN
jgi:hypothetical protein